MNPQSSPTPAELEILKVLWEIGPATVREVHEHLAREKPVVFNTVQTLLRLMEFPKGLVTHRVEGRSFIYSASYSRDDSTAGFLQRVFDGAADALVQSLLRSEAISSKDLERIQAMIEEARRKKQSS